MGGASKNKANKNRSASSGNITARIRKTERWKDSSFRRQILAGCAALLAIAIILPIVAFFAAYSVTKVPEPEELVNNQISYIMASDNKKELARIVPPEGNRQNVSLNEIPEVVRDAVLAAEDRDYYNNPGFSITGFGRAALGQLLGRSGAGGGSTITQQYVKNALVGDEYSVMRKAKELVISAKMAREWSKDEILEAYLNTIYFGRNAYGISSAAHAYFDKNVKDLTAEEGAVLAASIQAPSRLDPWTNREAAESRWKYVMDGMQDIGAISRDERIAAVYPEVKDPATTTNTSFAEGTNGLIKSRVISELEAAGITEDQVNTGGLRITTTIDPKVQEAAVDEYHTQKQGYQDNLLGAVVSVDPKTGSIRAWYGGDDPVGFDWAGAGLQTGSTFKIIALAAYLDQGGSIYDLFDSSPVTTGDTLVQNVGNESCGTCAISQALKMSLNTSFIRLTRKLKGGAQDVADMAHRLGVAEELPGIGKTLTENGKAPFEGITLGQYQSSPLDMASVLATLANEGVYHRPHFVQKVETLDGEVLLDNTNPQGDQVISKDVADNVITAMEPIAAYSNGNSLAGGRPSAAKTGTAQLGDTGKNKDAWMIGATPQLATAVWIGAADGAAVSNQWGGQMYGSGLPATIWKNVMDRALEGQDVEYFAGSADTSSSYQSSGQSGYQAPAPVQQSPSTGGGNANNGAGGTGTTAPGQNSPPGQKAPSAPAPGNGAPPNSPPPPGLGEIIGNILG
ncbi:transglycosylase domain-containing protein [Corynebacterium anserum]|uniref:Penicillin-binding protein n=1 Tax=Corynebacterium anserum TaxID=2684406 RepID=A0A7G7YRE2_9CORY|nr:penicillin-binding protein [Corynebacterium anserum]QNH97062.1 penicillin-binding protein [Corynebacterium anserum]